MSMREELFDYIREKYNVLPEYPWMRFPGYAVFRHGDNDKLFAMIMDVPRDRLGLAGNAIVDVLNVKMGSTLLADLLMQQEGYLRGWHIGRGNWVSVLLDGTVPLEEARHWIDESYMATASAKTRHAARPPKAWIIPSNPKYFDIVGAFAHSDEILWKQGAGIKRGDTVFMYVAAPYSAVLYKCLVTETDIPYNRDEGKVRIKSLMKIRLLKGYAPNQFTFERLGEDYGIFAVRGPRGIPDKLIRDLE